MIYHSYAKALHSLPVYKIDDSSFSCSTGIRAVILPILPKYFCRLNVDQNRLEIDDAIL